MMTTVTPAMIDRFTKFSIRNARRCEAANGFNHKLDEWSTSDWMVALVGEIGEAANIIKKLNRVRDGIPNRKGETAPMMRVELAMELADAFTYLDLLAQSLGLDILDEAEVKFSQISQEIGYVETPDLFERALKEIADDKAAGLWPRGEGEGD
jgi:NTP pyrophosphatase (non-canonical NTP hydrolase)